MKMMKSVRCSFEGHFYIDVDEEATPDDIENALMLHIIAVEDDDLVVVDEYNWNEVND